MSSMIALVGRPNVGKSSLFNRLLRRSAALVDDRPGVTRDRHYAHLVIDDRQGLLIDTGGFETGEGDPLAGPVAAQIMAAVEQSDLVVFVTDGLSGPHPRDAELARLLRRSGRRVVLCVNKIDGPQKMADAHEFHSLGLEPVMAVSAAHGFGLEALRTLIWDALAPVEAEPEEGASPRVAIIGRPNAGKSSLVNRLCGEDRQVVHERPGTTRDAVDVDIISSGKRYTLVDTAGVRRRGRVEQKLEKLSVMRAIKGVEGSDVAVLVIDALEGLADQDAHIAGYAHERGRPLMILINKWDQIRERLETRKELKRQLELKMVFLDKAPVMTVSALTGAGLDKLLPMVDRIMEQYVFRAKTHEVNDVLEKAMAAHTPPQAGRTRLKFYYATQASTRPPTFVAFANRPDSVHFSYRRFLVNQLKKAFGLDLVPVRLYIRDRHDDEARPPRPKSKGKAAPKKGLKPGSKKAPKSAPKTGSKPKSKPELKIKAEPRSKAAFKAEPRIEAAPRPKSEADSKPEPKTKAEPSSKAALTLKIEAASKAEPKTKVAPKAAPKTKAALKPKSEAAPKAEPETKAVPKPKTIAETKTKRETKAGAKAKTGAQGRKNKVVKP